MMKKPNTQSHRLYYVEHYPSTICEELELYTWEDIQQVVQCSQHLHPENSYVIREFEHT